MEVLIQHDDQQVVVYYVNRRGERSELAYVDKHTSMEDVAQGFYELAAALNAPAQLESYDVLEEE